MRRLLWLMAGALLPLAGGVAEPAAGFVFDPRTRTVLRITGQAGAMWSEPALSADWVIESAAVSTQGKTIALFIASQPSPGLFLLEPGQHHPARLADWSEGWQVVAVGETAALLNGAELRLLALGSGGIAASRSFSTNDFGGPVRALLTDRSCVYVAARHLDRVCLDGQSTRLLTDAPSAALAMDSDGSLLAADPAAQRVYRFRETRLLSQAEMPLPGNLLSVGVSGDRLLAVSAEEHLLRVTSFSSESESRLEPLVTAVQHLIPLAPGQWIAIPTLRSAPLLLLDSERAFRPLFIAGH